MLNNNIGQLQFQWNSDTLSPVWQTPRCWVFHAKAEWYGESFHHRKWRQNLQMFRMPDVIWSIRRSEEAHGNPQQRNNICLCSMPVDIGVAGKLKSTWLLEHKTCDIMAAERLRLMRFDNRLIIDSFREAICILKWWFSINNKFKTEK